MTREETSARRQLEALAEDQRGRQLLQLALRGIQTSGHGLTIGCWVKPGGGVSGCVFQHAYWQGVAESVFDTTDAASREIKQLVDERDFHAVMEAIRALDRLGKHRFLRRRGLRRELDEAAWRDTVEQLLVDVLAESPRAAGREPVASSV
ncbi:MAG: hypothetical protein ACLPY3_14945 [Solirubrobacteraceae bacterium]